MALLRPSELARVWELSPKTVYLWIKAGRLPAIKTPGAQYRVREGDVRTYCEKNGLPLPKGLTTIAPPAAVVAMIGKPGATSRAVAKACKENGAELRRFAGALDGLLAVAAEVPDVVAIDARTCDVDVKLADALRALRRTTSTANVPVVVYDAVASAASLLKLGATHVFRRGEEDAAVAAIAAALR